MLRLRLGPGVPAGNKQSGYRCCEPCSADEVPFYVARKTTVSLVDAVMCPAAQVREGRELCGAKFLRRGVLGWAAVHLTSLMALLLLKA